MYVSCSKHVRIITKQRALCTNHNRIIVSSFEWHIEKYNVTQLHLPTHGVSVQGVTHLWINTYVTTTIPPHDLEYKTCRAHSHMDLKHDNMIDRASETYSKLSVALLSGHFTLNSARPSLVANTLRPSIRSTSEIPKKLLRSSSVPRYS